MNPASQYFVITHTGDKFGPVDIYALNQWGNEGRILPHTILEEAATGRRIYAAQLPGLVLPNENAYRSPYQQSPNNYPRIVETQADKWASWAIAMGYCSIFLCPGLSIIGLIMAIIASSQGAMKGKKAVTINIIATILLVVELMLLKGAAGWATSID